MRRRAAAGVARRLPIALVAVALPVFAADAAPACSCVAQSYRVGRIYKGGGHGINTGRRVKLRSARNGASCGLDDRIGRLVGLFAYREQHRSHSNSCLTTTPRKLRRAARASTAGRAGSPASAGCG